MKTQQNRLQDIKRLLKRYVDDCGASGWDPIFGEGIVNFVSYDEVLKPLILSKEDVASIMPTDSTKYIPVPEQKDIPLNAKLTITLDRQLTCGDVVDIKLFRGDKEVQTSLTSNFKKQEIVVSPTGPFLPRTTYRLLPLVEHGLDYKIYFVTGN